jgi:hypothetical protein
VTHGIEQPKEHNMTLYRDANDPDDPEDLDEFEPNRLRTAACAIMCLLALGIAALVTTAVLS